jgi:hypothetical protein
VRDFNGDGKLDLAVTNFDPDTVSILPGTGTGSFGARTDFGTGVYPFSVAVGDFNGDGKLDLAVANLGSIFVNDTRPNTVSILLNTGTVLNAMDDPLFFVRQHYLDFLNREPDTQGLTFWTNEITSCGGDAQCAEGQTYQRLSRLLPIHRIPGDRLSGLQNLRRCVRPNAHRLYRAIDAFRVSS